MSWYDRLKNWFHQIAKPWIPSQLGSTLTHLPPPHSHTRPHSRPIPDFPISHSRPATTHPLTTSHPRYQRFSPQPQLRRPTSSFLCDSSDTSSSVNPSSLLVLGILVLSSIVLLPIFLPVAATEEAHKLTNATVSNGTFSDLDKLSMGHLKYVQEGQKNKPKPKDLWLEPLVPSVSWKPCADEWVRLSSAMDGEN